MFYHYNNIENKEADILSASYRNEESNPLIFYNNDIKQSASHKSQLGFSFSEKYEALKDNNKSIIGIVFPKKSTILLLIYILTYISYLYVGAFGFKSIELNKEIEDRSKFMKFRTEFLKNHSCLSDSIIEEFISEVQILNNRGVNALGNATAPFNNWDLTSAVFFVTALVTTIGYGNDKPVTNPGKIFCIVFVAIGVPMTMMMISAVVERLSLLTELVCSGLFYKMRWQITEKRFREIQITVSFLLLAICFFIIPAISFTMLEESQWSFLDSIYFCVISLTTIGLGDLVPGQSSNLAKRNISRIAATVYLFTGLIAASYCIRIFHGHPKWSVGGKFIYLKNQPDLQKEFCVSTSSIHSDTSSDDSKLPLVSYPVQNYVTKPVRQKRVRYNSFS